MLDGGQRSDDGGGDFNDSPFENQDKKSNRNDPFQSSGQNDDFDDDIPF